MKHFEVLEFFHIIQREGKSGFFHVGKESRRERNEFSFLLDSLFWFFLILGGKKRRLENFFFQIFIRIIWWNIGILYYTTNQTTKENITLFFPSFKNMVWIMQGILLLWQWFEGKWINYYLPIKSILLSRNTLF